MTPIDSSPSTDRPPLGPQTIAGLLLTGTLSLLIWLLFREMGVSILLAAALILIWPHRRTDWARSTFSLLLLLGVLWILHKARMVVYPLLAGLLLAYWLVPLVDRMERRRIPRGLGALLTLLPALAAGALFILLVGPMLVDQLSQLIAAVPGLLRTVYDWLVPVVARYLPDGWQADAGKWLGPLASHLETVARGLWGGASGLTRGVGALLAFLGMIVLAPVLTYYLLVDFHKMRAWISSRFPASRDERMAAVARVLDSTFRSYFRGQVLVALFVGVIFTAGFLVIGLPFAVVLGFVGGLLNLVPVIGFWTTTALCILAAVLSGHAGPMLLRLGIVLVVEQFIEGQILTPRIVGRAVGLNPAVILVAALAFGTVLGPLGILIAVPAVATLVALLDRPPQAGPPPPPPPSNDSAGA